MAVIKDVAEYAKVSVGSVSRYLKNPMQLKESTRDKIEEAISYLKYSPSLSARGMRNQNLQRVVLVMNDVNNPYFANMFTSVQKHASLRGMEVSLYNPSPEKKKFQLELMDMPNRSFNKMIYCFLPEWEPAVEYAAVNTVTIDSLFISGRKITDDASTCVIDYSLGIKDMLEKAFALGHRRVCYVGNYLNKLSENTKFVTVKDTVEAKMEEDDQYLLETIDIERMPEILLEGRWDWQRGMMAAEAYVTRGLTATLLVFKNDLTALGAMRYFITHGVRVPEDVSIVGCDNIMNGKMSVPTLATIDTKIENLCEEAVGMLEEMSCYYPAKPIHREFKTCFVEGESLGEAPKK